jgi:hypothetical protein
MMKIIIFMTSLLWQIAPFSVQGNETGLAGPDRKIMKNFELLTLREQMA